jgi:hypothetical protein
MGRGANNSNLLYQPLKVEKDWREIIPVNQFTLAATNQEELFSGSNHPNTVLGKFNGTASLLIYNKEIPVDFIEQKQSSNYQAIVSASIDCLIEGMIHRPREIIAQEDFDLINSPSDEKRGPLVCFPIINTAKQSGRDFIKAQDYYQSPEGQPVDYSNKKTAFPTSIKYCLAADIIFTEQSFNNQGTWKYDHQSGDLFYYLNDPRKPLAGVWNDLHPEAFDKQ